MKKKLLSVVMALIMVLSVLQGMGRCVEAASIPSGANLKNTYATIIPKIGTACVASEILDPSVIQYAKRDFNSMTVGNEMKPDYLLGWSANLISLDQARARGYYVPDNYPESTVPNLDFSTVDKILKTCYENGLALRGHTLLWHAQTPDWFFKSGYNKNNGYVSQSVMNKRMEYFIKTYVGHICTSQYGSVLYAWDVANEFLHAQNSGWQAIYGRPSTSAQFIKDAFNYAYDTLSYYNLTEKVKLFYNDYNTYMEVNDVIKLINFINSGRKVCAGIGMQSHLSTDFPSPDYFKAAIDSFRKAGFEIQITEMDAGCKDFNTQATYYYNIFKGILEEKKLGANITAIVWWGISDNHSWRSSDRPLLYSDYNTKKPAYDAVLQAYFDAGYTMGGGGNPTPTANPTPTPSIVSGDTVSLNEGWYYIKNVNAQKYLQVTNNSGTAGQNVELRTGSGMDGQKWYLKNVSDGYFTLTSALGDFMLDISYGENTDGANVGIYNAYSGDAQQFLAKTSSKDGAYIITTKVSNQTKVLDGYENGTADGTNVCQWSFNGKANQQWIFEKVGGNVEPTATPTEAPNPTNTPVPTATPTATPTPVVGDQLDVDYTIYNWGSGYQVSFKISNPTNSKVNSWTLKVKRSEINMESSWNVNVKESGEYYVITPVTWNSTIEAGGYVEFGIQGVGSIGSTIQCSVE